MSNATDNGNNTNGSSKKIMAAGICLCVIMAVCVVLVSVFRQSGDKASDTAEEMTHEEITTELSSEISSFTYEEEPVTEVSYEGVTGPFDEDTEIAENYVYFDNIVVINEILPLHAVQLLYDDLTAYLVENGYGDCHAMTVLTDSIIADKGYPYFECDMEESNGKIVGITFDLESYTFSFSIKDK